MIIPHFFKFWNVNVVFDNFLQFKKWGASPNIPHFFRYPSLAQVAFFAAMFCSPAENPGTCSQAALTLLEGSFFGIKFIKELFLVVRSFWLQIRLLRIVFLFSRVIILIEKGNKIAAFGSQILVPGRFWFSAGLMFWNGEKSNRID